MKAYLLFAEHRYFGESRPFGNDSFKNGNHYYLTAEQALADYAVLLRYYKTKVLNCPDCPVIAFGGSYGGMLAAWMRMKFPNIIDGALAASAPILWFKELVPGELFYSVATWDFGNTSSVPDCAKLIKHTFNRLDSYINSTGNQYQVKFEI